jgi:hypothetical protein
VGEIPVNTALTSLCGDVVSHHLLPRGYSNFDERCYSNPRRPSGHQYLERETIIQ